MLLVFLARTSQGLHRDTLPVTPFSIDVSNSAPLSSGAFFSIQFEFSKIAPAPSPSLAKARSRVWKKALAPFLDERRECRRSRTPSMRPVLKLNYATLIPAIERWRGLRIGEFGRCPLQAIRDEVNRAYASRTAAAVTRPQKSSPARFPASRRLTAPAAGGLDDSTIRPPCASPLATTNSWPMRPYGNRCAFPPVPAHQDDCPRPVEP